ncbi:hypothetical protein CB1_000843004 [Camelus ferus]|nr:hypothetical protein CB1_000843004 [Camelus ferus]
MRSRPNPLATPESRDLLPCLSTTQRKYSVPVPTPAWKLGARAGEQRQKSNVGDVLARGQQCAVPKVREECVERSSLEEDLVVAIFEGYRSVSSPLPGCAGQGSSQVLMLFGEQLLPSCRTPCNPSKGI